MTSSFQVPVAGMGLLCACGSDVSSAFDGALTGRAYFALPAARVCSTYTSKFPVFMVPPADCEGKPADITYSQFFFVQAAKQAFAQAGITPQQLNAKRVGVVVGASVHPSFHCFEIYKNWKTGHFTSTDVDGLYNYLSSPLAQWISQYFGFSGPFQTVVTACAGGTDAIGLAKSWIETGLCDAVLCGGTDEISQSPYDGFIRLLVSTPQRCKPFSKNRTGINLGEGAAALLLTHPQLAKDLHLPCQGYVLGYGNAADGFHPTAPQPQGLGLQRAFAFAMRQAGLTPQDLAFINVHGTASQANDLAEATACQAILPGVPVWGSKGVTGHTLGAAGAVEAVLSLQALKERMLPATVGFKEPDENLHLIPTTQNTPIVKRFAVSDSLAFGGCNAAVVLGASDAA